MSSFVVNPETLQALQQAVAGLAVELENGPSATAGYGSTYYLDGETRTGYMISGGQLNGADTCLDPFFQAWSDSLGQIGQNMENVAKALGAAAERYAEVDDHVCLANP